MEKYKELCTYRDTLFLSVCVCGLFWQNGPAYCAEEKCLLLGIVTFQEFLFFRRKANIFHAALFIATCTVALTYLFFWHSFIANDRLFVRKYRIFLYSNSSSNKTWFRTKTESSIQGILQAFLEGYNWSCKQPIKVSQVWVRVFSE